MNRYNPTVKRSGLYLLAGAMWTGVGIMLCAMAVSWLSQDPSLGNLLLGLLGLAVAAAAYRALFANLALKNIRRINLTPDRACVFSFLEWKGYLIIAVMMTTGILLRNSSIPKPYLAVVYAAIGGALFLASLSYYAKFFRVKKI